MQHHPGSWYVPWGVPLQKMLTMPYQHPAATAALSAAAAASQPTQISPYAAPSVSPNGTNGALTCQVLPTHPHQAHQHQHSPNSAAAAVAAVAAAMQAAQTAPHNYQHHAVAAAAALHANQGTPTQGVPALNAATNSPYNCSPATAGTATTATLHPHQHHHNGVASGATTSQHTALLTGSSAHLQNAQLQNTHAQALHAQAAAAAAAAMFTPLSLRTFLSTSTSGNPLASLTAAQPPMNPCGPPAMHQQNSVSAVTAAAIQQMTCVPTTASQQLHQHQQLQSQHQHQHQHQHAHHQTPHHQSHQHQSMSAAAAAAAAMNLNAGVVAMRQHAALNGINAAAAAAAAAANNLLTVPIKKLMSPSDKEKSKLPEKRKAEDSEQAKDLKKAKLETKALKAKRPGFTDERYHETSYYIENGLRKVYPYYFTFTTFTKGRWVGEKILDVFAREFRAHPAEEYERCIKAGTLTVNYEKVPIDYRLKHNDLLANIVHRHEVPVTSQPITIVHMDDDIVVVNKPASIPVHPCGRYRHNTVVFILAKEYNLKNLRTIHRLDRLTSGLLLFGRSPKKARQMEHQIRNRQVQKEYICRVEGNFPEGIIECKEPIEVVSYKIGVCKVSLKGKDCTTTFQKIAHNGKTSVVLCKPRTGRMHQIRVHLQYLGYPVVNDPLYNHEVFGPLKGRGGDIGGKTDEELVRDLINIHNAENWLGIDSDSDISLFKSIKSDCDAESMRLNNGPKGNLLSDDDSETVSREASPCSESPQTAVPAPFVGNESPNESTSSSLTTGEHELKNTSANEFNNVGSSTNNASTTTTTTIANGTNFPTALISRANPFVKVTVATQTGHESPDMAFNAEKMTADSHCYECKVRYRDPKPKDLVMYLHAWKYKGPGWEYETELPNWASTDWIEESD